MHIAEKLKKKIDFKDNQINTRVLLKDDDKLALLAAIKKDQLMAEHISPVDAFIYIVEGEVEFSIKENINAAEQNDFKLKEGDIFFFKANEKHCVTGKKDSLMLVVRI